MSTNQLVAFLPRVIRAGVVGGAVAAWQTYDGIQTVVAEGAAELVPERRTVTPSTWFDLASLTKPLVGTSLMLLAMRSGRLSLTTTVGEILPETENSAISNRTMIHLLSHTSGWKAWHPIYAEARGNPELALSSLLEIAPVREAGIEVTYSCLGFVLLRFILERVFDARLDQVFTDEIIDPLDLHNGLSFRLSEESSNVASGSAFTSVETELTLELGLDPTFIPVTGHRLPDDGNSRFLGGVSCNAGLFGTASGVLDLAACFLPGRRGFFSDEEIGTVTRNWTPGLKQARGLGWQLASTPGCSAGTWLSKEAYGHTGFTGTSVWIDPKLGMVAGLLSHRHHPMHRGKDLHPVRRTFHRLLVSETTG
jgi:CubicO group peptidase (beta-lactamase class C family)